jgi:hypothetical protein
VSALIFADGTAIADDGVMSEILLELAQIRAWNAQLARQSGSCMWPTCPVHGDRARLPGGGS